MIRKAERKDIVAVAAIYDEIHASEERGEITVGWERGVYPTESTAENAFNCGELFVEETEGRIVAAAIINRKQVDVYKDGDWLYKADDGNIMVLHTLVVSPSASGKGCGKAFVAFYEEYALKNNCHVLRMDTNERNEKARAMYRKLGYREAGIIPTVFNGIPGVGLVLLEKRI